MSLSDLEAKLSADLAKAKEEFAALEAATYPGKKVAIIAAVAFAVGLVAGLVL